MGDPRKTRKKYQTPAHPWQKDRLDSETEINKKYALGNKKEIWKMVSKLKNFKEQAKKLESLATEQAKKEKEFLVKKLKSLALIKPEDNIEAVLTLTVDNILDRRLQTIVLKVGLARSMKQARQFITHGHITISGKVITSPSYLVLESEEAKIGFKSTSGLSNPDNPERQIAKPVVKKSEEETKKSDDKKTPEAPKKTKEKKVAKKKKTSKEGEKDAKK